MSEVGLAISNILFAGFIESTTDSTRSYRALASTGSIPFPNQEAVAIKLIFARVNAT